MGISMEEEPDVRMHLPEDVDLASTVVVGVCDVSGAGCACVSDVLSDTYRRSMHSIEIEGMVTQSIFESEHLVFPLQLCNFCDEAGGPILSLITINTILESRHHSILFAVALAELLRDCEIVLLVAGTIFPPALRKESIARCGLFSYEGTNTYAKRLGDLSTIPLSTPIMDELLSSIIHVLQATSRPFGCIFAMGYKERHGEIDRDALYILQDAIVRVLGPRFFVDSCKLTTLSRWNEIGDSRTTYIS